jgi:GT2 family glycosyltransferase
MSDRVVVAWLDPGHVDGDFAESVVRLVATGTHTGTIAGFQRVHSGPVLSKTRSDLTERFLRSEADWLLMLDSDMAFDPDLIDRLLEIADPATRPVVGPLCYSVNHDGAFPVAYRMVDGRFALHTSPPENTLMQVDGLGAACLLVHRSVFEKVRDESAWPGRWFDTLFLDDQPLGEDLSFMLRLRAAGIPVHVHTGIPIRHMKWKLAVDADTFAMWRRRNRFVITGTGRSGTRYAAAVLSALQISCGHELIYRPDGPIPWANARGDSSWMAAPHLQDFYTEHPEGTVVHLLRNPLDVINSLVGIGFFDDTQRAAHGPYRDYAEQHCPQAFLPNSPAERAATFVVDWNRRIEPWAKLRAKVEDLTPQAVQTIAQTVGSDPALLFVEKQLATVPTDLNHRPRAALGWDDVPDRVRHLAVEYGYET